jgi:hypothetical protein
MSLTDQLQALGQQLTSVLISTYGSKFPDGNLVFLPGGLSVPDDIVQSGVVNPTQMQTWMAVNFDYPFVVSSGDASVLLRDESHGTTSQIYSLAVSQAQPIGDPTGDTFKRVDAEIATAQGMLGPANGLNVMSCEPDDWPFATAGYWSPFDSMQTQSSTTTTPAPAPVPVPIVNRNFWMLRSLAAVPAVQPAPAPPPVRVAPSSTLSPRINISERLAVAPAVAARPALMESRLGATAVLSAEPPVSEVASAAGTSELMEAARWRSTVELGRLPTGLNAQRFFSSTQTVSQVTTTVSSTIDVSLQHQCVTIGRTTAGQSWWYGVFLADQGWSIPGMQQGGLLPAPSDASTSAINGLPIAMIVVQNLKVTGNWSQEALAALQAPSGSVGPLSLFGATPTTNGDNTITFGRAGMQVVALLCSPLPVLPPAPVNSP